MDVHVEQANQEFGSDKAHTAYHHVECAPQEHVPEACEHLAEGYGRDHSKKK